jgi:hypothetical protein
LAMPVFVTSRLFDKDQAVAATELPLTEYCQPKGSIRPRLDR